MPSALRGPVACARCAAPTSVVDERCPRCGVPLEAVAPGSALVLRTGPLTGTVRAGAGRRRGAVTVDLALLLAIAAAVAVAVGEVARPLGGALALALVAGTAAACLVLLALALLLAGRGRTPGRLTAGTATVDSVTGMPPRTSRAVLLAVVAGRGRSVLTVDLRRGRDPRILSWERAPLPADDRPLPVGPAPAPLEPRPVDAQGVRLLFDGGDELVVDGAVLLGRDPEAPALPRGAAPMLHALPDLSRGLARTHLQVEWADGLLWVTDLGAPGGSAIRTDAGGSVPLVPEVRTAVAPGWQVRLGGRSFSVRSMAALPPEGTEAARGR